MGSPSSGSSTVRRAWRPSTLGRCVSKYGWRCRTTAIMAGRSGGRLSSSERIGTTPPAEPPRTMTSRASRSRLIIGGAGSLRLAKVDRAIAVHGRAQRVGVALGASRPFLVRTSRGGRFTVGVTPRREVVEQGDHLLERDHGCPEPLLELVLLRL